MEATGKHQNPINDDCYRLRLFVTGASANSLRAINNLNSLCEQHLQGNFILEIIDVHQEPERAEREQIIALPMLIKSAPLPARKLIGDLSDTDKMLRVLGLK